jgi:hypothetical protein
MRDSDGATLIVGEAAGAVGVFAGVWAFAEANSGAARRRTRGVYFTGVY